MTATEQTKSRQAPETAFAMPAGAVQFAAGEGPQGRISVTARTGNVVEHWYWGPIVHDMAGLKRTGDRIAFDWHHSPVEGSLGYGDKFDVSSGDLVIEGELISFKADDRAAEILHKGRKGVPYEASIYYDPYNSLRMEMLPEGMFTQVNGRQVEGPCVIVREWLLRGVALCLYGADPGSSTEFASGGKQITVNLLTAKGESMSTANNAAAANATAEGSTEMAAGASATVKSDQPGTGVQAAAAAGGQAPPADPRTEFQATLAKFTTAFGAENGAKWAAEGKTYAEACELQIAAQANQMAAKDQEITALKAKLGAINTGESDAVSFSSGETKDQSGQNPAPTKFAHLGTNLSKFAAGIKLPNK